MLESVIRDLIRGVLGGGLDISVTNPLPVTSEAGVEGGTATGGTVNTLIDTAKGWQVNIWQHAILEVEIGGVQYTREIDSNTADTLDFTSHPLPAAVVAGCPYSIRLMISTDTQVEVMDEDIRDVLPHYSNWVVATTLDGITFFCDSLLDEAVQVQIEGHYLESVTRPVNVGAVVGIAAGGDSAALGIHRTSTAWLYCYRVVVTALIAPTVNSIVVTAILQPKT